jgi:prevent-host-death family protein
MRINIHEAKTHLSRLLQKVAAGGEVVISNHGHPVARLVPIRKTASPRRLGALKGRIRIAEDFDAPLPKSVLAKFLGSR